MPPPVGQRTQIMPLLRVRVGLPDNDTSQDAAIDRAFNLALALAETYADRKFEANDQSETFTHYFGRTLSLQRYPVIEVTGIDENALYYHIDKMAGLVMLDHMAAEHQIAIDYRGGYTDAPETAWPYIWPDDLLFALFQVFDKAWAAGNAPGEAETGSIKSIRAGDLSINYGNDQTDYGAVPGFGGMIPVAAALIIEQYARRKA